MSKVWIGVDLDGTLAHYDKWRGVDHIGEPIQPMVDRVRKWLAEGKEVRIFTARVSLGGRQASASQSFQSFQHIVAAKAAIQRWCLKHLGQELQITCEKDLNCIAIYDDRAIQVEVNTGRLIDEDIVIAPFEGLPLFTEITLK